MEIKIKIKTKIERRGPDSEPKWGILKYLSVEFFTENQRSIRVRRRANVGQTTRVSDILGQKLGYDSGFREFK